jgi:Tat protein translocase TatC
VNHLAHGEAHRQELAAVLGRAGFDRSLVLGGVSQPSALKEGDQIQYIFSQDTVVSEVKVPASTSVPARVVKKVVDKNEALVAVTTQAIVINGAVAPAGAEIPGVLGSTTVVSHASCEGGLVLTTVQGAFTLYMSVALYAAVAFAIPFLLFQAWAFIAPGLYRHEKKYIGPVLAMASVFFAIGATFAYKIAFPAACDYLIGLQIEGGFRTLINAEDYLNLILIIMLGLGLVFQIPVIAFILGRVGLITPRMLWKSWRYAIVIIAIAAARDGDTWRGQRRRQLLACQDLLVHTCDEDLLVVRPVEDPDAAALRKAPLTAPQEVVVELLLGWLLEGEHLASLRVHPRHDVSDGAVLPGGVHRLKHQQQGVAVLGVQLVLLLGQPLDPLLQQFPGRRFLIGRKTSRVARVDVFQAEFLTLGDAIRLDELFELFQELPTLLFHGNRSPGR